MAQASIKLHNLDSNPLNHTQTQAPETLPSNPSPQPQNTEFSLPPVDTGKAAWLFLAASWGVEVVTFGFAASFGVFLDYYRNNAPFAGSRGIAAIGTTASGIMYTGMPFLVLLCRLYPRQARWYTLYGLFVSSLALALSSFCTTIPTLLLTQGMLFGVGACFAYCPANLYIDEWFVRRKGLAYGIVWSAGGIGGVVFPLILESLLKTLGFQSTARICAGIMFGSAAPLAWFIKPRIPVPKSKGRNAGRTTSTRRPINMRFVKSRLFGMHQFVNVVQAMGYFLPALYLPTYARTTFNASTFLSALTVMLVNLSTTVGLVVMGSLSDRLHVTTCMIVSAAGVAVSVLVVWGLSASLPILYLFCIFYGLFAGSWASIWPGIMREVAQRCGGEEYGYTDPVMVHGHLCVGRGVGNIVSGPLSDSLIRGMPWQGKVMGGYGSGFGILILFTGVTGGLSGMNYLWRCLDLL